MQQKLKSFCILPIMLLLPMMVCAQITIKGKVTDRRNGEALIGANVIDKADEQTGTITDFDGEFDLKANRLPTVLRVTYIGYEELEIEVTDASRVIQIKLDEESVTMDVVIEVKGQRMDQKIKESPLTIESLDAIAIRQTASSDFYSGLGALKGVDLTTASLGFTVINTRGFNSTSPVRSLQIIDGVDNQSPGLNFSLGNFLGAPELDIQKVDLVVGASSAFYGPNAFNGVISMETKSPFFHKGLAASVKKGERNLFETAIRYADAFKNKEGKDVLAFKVNAFYLTANDWVADNYDPVTEARGNQVFAPGENPGRWDAVNIYGDEPYPGNRFSTLFDARAGLNSFHRRGYREEDIVDYDTRNLKLSGAMHLRLQPSKEYESTELIFASSYGNGTTVYQGDNRFSLRGIQFWQNRLEIRKKDRFFVRAYSTREDAGRSYDPYFTALQMQREAKNNDNWSNDYQQWWVRPTLGNVFNRMRGLGYPSEDVEAQIAWQRQFSDSLAFWHSQAAAHADRGFSLNSSQDFFEPGTARFDSLFNDITGRLNNSQEGGTRFFSNSALYHAHGEYRFPTKNFKELVVGANARLYRPDSRGTIFSDSIEFISNFEYGIYGGGSKKVGDFIFSATLRMDKNQNFNHLLSPAASVVWNHNENSYLRVSLSSAIRNPTLSDQYLSLRVGPAELVGNLDGFEGLITQESFQAWRNDQTQPLQRINVDPIRPERVRTLEVGYKTRLLDNLFLDASYYYNTYNDFIGFNIGLVLPFDTIIIFPGAPPSLLPRFKDLQVFRVSANSDQTVTSQGFALGLNYYFNKYYGLSGNYSFNELITQETDNIVPAFNTPRHKFNVGISGRDIPLTGSEFNLGFNVNFKWIEGFIFEGSPQFTGLIPTYHLLDAQINATWPKNNLTLKLGASNVLNNMQFQTYGGPRIGRMATATVIYDFKKKI
jgi:iron complex outermembrane recepter protein